MGETRRKTVTAGRYVRTIQYNMIASPLDGRRRSPKVFISSAAQEAMNLKHSFQKLKAVLAANFSENDIVLTLTYRPDRQHQLRQAAENRLKLFIRRWRKLRQASGQLLPYVYVTEAGHSSGLLHHHIVTTNTGGDLPIVRGLWAKDGDNIHLSYIKDKGYGGWAEYLSKEPRDGRRRVGERMWRSSIGLLKPTVITEVVPSGTLPAIPPGAFIMDRQERNNGYGSFLFIEYLLPENTVEVRRFSDLG